MPPTVPITISPSNPFEEPVITEAIIPVNKPNMIQNSILIIVWKCVQYIGYIRAIELFLRIAVSVLAFGRRYFL